MNPGGLNHPLPATWDIDIPTMDMTDLPPLDSLESLHDPDSYSNNWVGLRLQNAATMFTLTAVAVAF
jgi:hypothetical protein